MSRDQSIERQENSLALHEHYMQILNCVSDSVYWIDVDCNLLGCNNHFITLLGMNELREVKETPYVQMKKVAHWPEKRVEAFKLDDMRVIFSGQPSSNVIEEAVINDQGDSLFFRSSRVPMYGENKSIIGLIVVLTKIEVALPKLISVYEGNKAHSGPKKTHPVVLMIEDNVIAQNVEKALLMALNCKVDIAESGKKALKLFTPGKYDLVLMDIGLEDTSGYVVAKRIRNKEEKTSYHVPIVALTGYNADIVKEDCAQYSMEGVITKPLTNVQAEQLIKHYVYHMEVAVTGLKSTLV